MAKIRWQTQLVVLFGLRIEEVEGHHLILRLGLIVKQTQASRWIPLTGKLGHVGCHLEHVWHLRKGHLLEIRSLNGVCERRLILQALETAAENLGVILDNVAGAATNDIRIVFEEELLVCKGFIWLLLLASLALLGFLSPKFASLNTPFLI